MRVTVLGIEAYAYTYNGQEVWKNGRLMQFQSGGKENSKTFSVAAVVDGEVLRVTANGKSMASQSSRIREGLEQTWCAARRPCSGWRCETSSSVPTCGMPRGGGRTVCRR